MRSINEYGTTMTLIDLELSFVTYIEARRRNKDLHSTPVHVYTAQQELVRGFQDKMK